MYISYVYVVCNVIIYSLHSSYLKYYDNRPILIYKGMLTRTVESIASKRIRRGPIAFPAEAPIYFNVTEKATEYTYS